MSDLEFEQYFTYLHEPNGQRPLNPQKAYSGGDCLESLGCPADQDVHGTLLQSGSLVCEDQGVLIFSWELAKGYFNVDLRTEEIQLPELGLNIISPEWQNVPQSNDAKTALEHSVPGKVSFTTKNAGVDFICQMKQSQAPCTPHGCVWDKDLAVDDGQYTKGEHFQSVNSFLFSGAFGTGLSCVDRKTNKRFFMKQVTWNKFRRSEVLIPIHLDHENLTKLYGVIQRDDMVDILMEDAGISLTYFVMLNPRLDERLVLDLTKHGLAGLKELHQNNVIHHDIKPDNLCVCTNDNGSLTLKVTDLGSARSVNQPFDLMAWTPAYLAPEACRKVLQKYLGNADEQITGKVDIFALGLTVLFMFDKQHVLLHKMTDGKVSYKDLSIEEKKKLDFHLLQYLAVWTKPPQDLFPKECSVKVQQLLTGMLSGSQDLRFSAGIGLAFIESYEIKEKECQQTQNGRLVTHPSENHQDAGEMSTIHGGVKDLTKEKLRHKMLKNIKERKVLEGCTDVQAMAETGRQNPKMETNLTSRGGNATIQASEWAAIDPWLGLHPAHQVKVSTKPAAQNSITQHQADISLRAKPEKRKHVPELRQHTGKKMRQFVSGDSNPLVPALPAPAILNSVRGLSKYNMMDGEMRPRKVDDVQPLHKDTAKPTEKDSAVNSHEGNMPDFSKLF
ncbi:hypothetical protein ACJMK2_024151 [Sinanodonta woodiana]|uniref:Protein kinase domain-containing protein n=1 Tax=Sinanodonta woodiana TaxID=1069815 RepID=A0ABD3T7C4_SINWO